MGKEKVIEIEEHHIFQLCYGNLLDYYQDRKDDEHVDDMLTFILKSRFIGSDTFTSEDISLENFGPLIEDSSLEEGDTIVITSVSVETILARINTEQPSVHKMSEIV